MSTRNPAFIPEAARLLEAAMNAAVEFAEAAGSGGLVPSGSPVRRGRVHLGRVRSRFPVSGPVIVVAGFGSVVWLGSPEDPVPPVGPMAFRGAATVDGRGRVVLDRQVRAWLAVEDPSDFEALVMAAPAGGVLVVPVEGYDRRLAQVGEVTP